jgi:dipeptidyl-peptidase-4
MEIRGIPAATAWLALALGIAGTPVGHGTPPASAQERAVAEAVSPDQASTKSTRLRLTVESTFGSSDFATSAYTARWRADGSSWTIVRPDDEERDELWEVDAESGADRLLVSADMLRPAVGSESISLDDYAFTADGLRVLILTDSEMIWRRSRRGRYWVLDLDTHALRAVSDDPGPQMLGKFSPDGRFVSFVREHDLFLADLSTGEERALTTDGDDEIINATTDWVYEEELSFYDAYRWSPDGRRIAYWRFDQSPIKPFYMIDDLELYPEPIPVRYPKTGTANSRVRVGSLELETGATTWFDTPESTRASHRPSLIRRYRSCAERDR